MAKNEYGNWLKQDLNEIVEGLSLTDLQKHFLRSRWMDQTLWMEGKANWARQWYYILRLITIVGGVTIPALVSLNVGGQVGSQAGVAIVWATFGISLLVAISAAIEGFFRYGERWRHYRQTVEWLKTEGWQFFQMSGRYRRYPSYSDAYPAFAARVEEVIQRDVDEYVTEVVRERAEGEREPRAAEATASASDA
jgi:hypothetical protein